MGEMWLGLWALTFIGLFIIVLAIYDYVDRKKRNREIKKWKYAIAIVIGLALMWPVIGAIVIHIPLFFCRR